MARNKGRRIAHFAPGGYVAPAGQSGTGGINATAQGLPSATPATGYTPGPQTNAAGSWGGAAESGGIPGDTNVSPQGAPNAWNYGYTPPAAAPAAAMPAAASNVYSNAPPPNFSPDMANGLVYGGGGAGFIKGGYGGGYGGGIPTGSPSTPSTPSLGPNPEWGSGYKGNNPVILAKGGAVPSTTPDTNDENPDDSDNEETGHSDHSKDVDVSMPSMKQGGKQAMSLASMGAMALDAGGAIPDTADMPIDEDQGQAGQAGDQQSPVQSALSAARQQFGLSDNIFNSLTDQLAGNIPAKPAGSGGEGPNPNPFPTKNGGFGQRASKDDNDGDTTVSAASGGAIPGDDPASIQGTPEFNVANATEEEKLASARKLRAEAAIRENQNMGSGSPELSDE